MPLFPSSLRETRAFRRFSASARLSVKAGKQSPSSTKTTASTTTTSASPPPTAAPTTIRSTRSKSDDTITSSSNATARSPLLPVREQQPSDKSDSASSPKSRPSPLAPPSPAAKTDYFSMGDLQTGDGSNTSERTFSEDDGSSDRKSSVSFIGDPPTKQLSGEVEMLSQDPSGESIAGSSTDQSVTFRQPFTPCLPQGVKRQSLDGLRIRDNSPPPESRFQHRVAFDNLPIGEATKHNTPSLTLNVRHKGYQARRRSRTFMVGIDENAYSDYAVQWLLDELVDDGDEVVCVRVAEKELRQGDKSYQDEAQGVMRAIIAKNGANRAVNFVLEYAMGKLHATFQKLIHMYQPAMLVVGTRGRSLGGIQGLVNTRNSFSKYCLQYSPVPVVVVRPTEKRIKKKAKRANDSTRQTYLSMLAATKGKHEADSEASSLYELEAQLSPDEEAHQVAKVLGLPASYDPTIKPLNRGHLATSRSQPLSPLEKPVSPSQEADRNLSRSPPSAAADSEDEEEEEAEFDVVTGAQAIEEEQKLKQLHKMEADEAAALRQPVDSDEESDEDSQLKKEAS